MKRLKLLSTLLVAGSMAAPVYGQVTINEIRIDEPGTDDDEYIEIAGTPGTSLVGMTVVIIGDGAAAAGSGVVERVVNLTGSIPASGHYLVAGRTPALNGAIPDQLFTPATDFAENNDNITYLLVTGNTATAAQDLDTVGADCVLDITPWTTVVDQVAIRGTTIAPSGTIECPYGPVLVGPDPADAGAGPAADQPSHALRCPDGSGAWQVGAVNPASGFDTPGAANSVNPVITTQPANQTACVGGSVTFSVVATGIGTLTYQWRKDGLPIPGANASSLTITPVAAADAGSYDVVVSDACGSTTSTAATLTVGGNTTIVTQPMGLTVFVGDPAAFNVVATGAPPITYQWRKDGLDIPGATADTLVINPTTLADSGTYDVVVTSGCGTVTSDPAILVVRAVPIVTINEMRVDQPSTDNDEYFELHGASGESLSGLTYVVIGDTSNPPDQCGIIEAIVNLTGTTIPGDGYFLCVEDTFTMGGGLASADLILSGAGNGLNFENADNVTHLLVRGFTGSNGQNLDTNDDGVLDVTPWSGVLDQVSLVGPAAGDCTYAATVGPDGNFSPGHVYRCPNGIGAWNVGPFDFNVGGRDTPGSPNPGPVIVTHPTSVAACAGSSATFTVVGAGGTLTYQWRKFGSDIPGATGASFTINPVTAGDAGDYDVVVSNGCSSVTSNTASLTLASNTMILAQPQSLCVFEGASATFSVSATGAPPLSYQWRKDGSDIPAATGSSHTINPVTLGDAGSYDVIVTSGCGPATSDPATLNVKIVPTVTINEIRTGQSGTDTDEYFELCGAPGASLVGLTYVVLGDGAGGSGVIELALDLTGSNIPPSGHFLAAEDTFSLACGRAPDLLLSSAGNELNFEDSDNVTHMIVASFSGFAGLDLDTNDDCTLDVTPWFTVLDEVSLIGPDAPPVGDCTYAPNPVGPDINKNGSFVPSHVYRCANCVGGWHIGSFTSLCLANETPGFGNRPCIVTQPESQSVCEGQLVTFSVVAEGTSPITYQWRKNGTDIGGATADSYTIPFVLASDAGNYDVVVTDPFGSVTSSVATLTVGALFDVFVGNVNGGAGPVTDVLFINNSAGSGPDRRIVIPRNSPINMRIDAPPSRLRAPYAVFGWKTEPTCSSRETLPLGTGDIAMPTPLTGNSPRPGRIANNTGRPNLGVENWPAGFSPTQPAPFVLANLPGGFPRAGTYYIQGIIFDSAAPNGVAGVTNGIVLVLQ